MKVKTKTQLKQSLAKIMEKCKGAKDFANFESDKATYEEIIKECYEALDKPNASVVSCYIAGREPHDLHKKIKPKEPEPCSPSTSSSEPSLSGTS